MDGRRSAAPNEVSAGEGNTILGHGFLSRERRGTNRCTARVSRGRGGERGCLSDAAPDCLPASPAAPVQLAAVLVPADALDRVPQDGAFEHRRPVQVHRLLGRVHPRLEGASHHQVHLQRDERERKSAARSALSEFGFDSARTNERTNDQPRSVVSRRCCS